MRWGLPLAFAWMGLACDAAPQGDVVDPTLGKIDLTLGEVRWSGGKRIVWDVVVGDFETEYANERVEVESDEGGVFITHLIVPCQAKPGVRQLEVRTTLVAVYGEVRPDESPGAPPTLPAYPRIDNLEAWASSRTKSVWPTCVAGETIEISLWDEENSYSGLMPERHGRVVGIGVNARLPWDKEVGDTVWDLRVTNNATPPETIWSARVNSSLYGQGWGELYYVGPCDYSPGHTLNTVEVTPIGVYPSAIDYEQVGDYGSPAPEGRLSSLILPPPMSARFVCMNNEDAYASFESVAAAWRSEGPTESALAVANARCRARLDSSTPRRDRPRRGYTLSWACETLDDGSGAAQLPASLLLSGLEVDCEGLDAPLSISPEEESEAELYDTELSRELLGSDRGPMAVRWEVTVNLDETLLKTHACRLRARATPIAGWSLWSYWSDRDPSPYEPPPAHAAHLDEDGGLRPAVPYPYITWDIALSDDGGPRRISAALGQRQSGIELVFASPERQEPIVFGYRFGQ